MIPASFDYVRPASVAEAVQALSEAGEDGKVLAGGQSLLPVLRLRLAYPETLIDLGGIDALRGVREDGDAIVIGAMTTHDEVLRDPLVREHAPVLAQATGTVGDRQVRHLGTFGGSLSHADPAGDLPAVALALEAELTLEGPGGTRTVAAADFFLDYLTTALAPDELLTSVRIRKLPGWSGHYEKFNRVAQAWSVVSVCAIVNRSGDTISGARIALTNMGATPLRARAVEDSLVGARNEAEIAEACSRAADGTHAPSDLSGAADYRNHLATVLARRAVLATG